MPDAVAFLSALAMSASYPVNGPITRDEAALLWRIADELRRLRADLEHARKERP